MGTKSSFFSGGGYHNPILPRPKYPKSHKPKKRNKPKRNMEQKKFSNSTQQIIKLTQPSLLKIAFTILILLTGCASTGRRLENLEAIMKKENVLIEKVKEERAQAEVSGAVLVSSLNAQKSADNHPRF